MTFKHKLSSRLARLWARRAPAAAVIAVGVIFGCLRAVPTDARTLVRLVILPPLVSLAVNQSTDFYVFGITDANDSVAVAVDWSATGGTIIDSSVVNGNGMHKGHFRAGGQPGSYKVMANDPASGKSDSASVVVTSTVSSIASVVVIPANAGAAVGGTIQFVAVPLDANGTALVTVTSAAPPPVASVTISPASASVVVGLTAQLSATLRDAGGNTLTGRTITWSSTNASVATVSGSGLVTGVAVGSGSVIATSESKADTAAVTVTSAAPPPVALVTISPASATVFVGFTSQLTATLRDANGNLLTGRNITWASSNTSVAAVNGSGAVTGVTTGSASVTATREGRVGTAAITVTTPPPPPTGSCLTQSGPLV